MNAIATANTMNINDATTVDTMSSRQIAEATKKNHADVIRDIKNMCAQLNWNVSKYAGIYCDARNRQQTEYNLPRYECEVLITGYDVKRRAAVIKRWHDLESGKTQPLVQQPQPDPYHLLKLNMDASLQAVTFARAFGLEGNQAMLAADRLLRHRLNFSPLTEMGHPALVAPKKEPLFTPTQLGLMSTPVYTAVHMNKWLQESGMQDKTGDEWVPTDKGKPFCEMLDVGKSHGNGTPVKQLKWYPSVLEQLHDEKPEPDYMPEPALDGDADNDPVKPVVTRKQKVKRVQNHKRGRYGLPEHFSIYELADELELQKSFIEEVLKKHRIIKWKPMKHGGKHILTDTGWHYGKMYDPTAKVFREKGKQLMTTNCHPVFGYEILKFF
ncbi:Rha family transcriptional regulator [Endozoicomonas atrinae]|uniref:Rha family transcriptional regulator n=1 Tax=Endozoicomonas atrinae TaxID=1333660 RepID=UPI000826421F|nr:Rha family transcriptional regulator [Endozoicomonas atrinae]